jgi:RNA polymerase sigma-70 factor (ECF subfamily)
MRVPADGAQLDAIEHLYRERLDEFCSVAAAIVRSREAAKDVVHDAFAQAVRKRGSFRGEGSLEAWVWRMVVNAALKQHRLEPPTDKQPSDNGTRSAPDLRGEIAALPPRQREVITLRDLQGLPAEEARNALGISETNQRVLLHRARSKVRAALERYFEAEGAVA